MWEENQEKGHEEEEDRMEGGGWILCDSFTVRQVVGGDSSNIFSKILSSGITSVGLIESFVSCFYYCVLFFFVVAVAPIRKIPSFDDGGALDATLPTISCAVSPNDSRLFLFGI